MKPSFKIRDNLFTFFSQSAVTGTEPTHFTWYTGKEYRDICFFTGSCLQSARKEKAKRKIAWMFEPPGYHDDQWDYVTHNLDAFDYVLTFVSSFYERERDKYLFAPCAGTFIADSDRYVHPKSKMCSQIFSYKTQLPGHRLRHDIARHVLSRGDSRVDLLGSGAGGANLPKIHALREYRFSITVMPLRVDNFWNEQVIDCFLTGTIPLYWGGGVQDLCRRFNPDGILFFDNLNVLDHLLHQISADMYDAKCGAIAENFELAKQFIHPEDYIWENYPFLFEEVK